MGQRISAQPNVPLVWILRGSPKLSPNPEQPIKFHYKSRRKGSSNYNRKCRDESPKSLRHGIVTRTLSAKSVKTKPERKFDVDLEDISLYLSKATLCNPANIPVVLTIPAVLYQTRAGGYQVELSLPLGMVVNGVFRNQCWLYAQTPHGEEGYIAYAACIPLGIVPKSDCNDASSPCWETSTDVFPRPSGNMTDTENWSTRSEPRRGRSRSIGTNRDGSAEGSVDRLYLRAASAATNYSTSYGYL